MTTRKQSTAHRVLLGTAGTGTSWGVLMSLREHFPGTFVLATDMADPRLVAASAAADAFEQVPQLTDPSFVGRIRTLIDTYEIDTYLPTFDLEVVLAARASLECRLAPIVSAPPLAAAELCHDKLASAEWLADRGYPTPETIPAAHLELAADDRWLLKPRFGIGSVGVRVVGASDELSRWREEVDVEQFVAQRLVDAPELTIDCFIGDGVGRGVCRERVEVKSGVCTKARVFDDSALEGLALEVGRELGLRGAFCFQAMRDRETNRWTFTDLNPRPGAGTRLSAAAGVNVHAATLADLWQLDPRPYLPELEREYWVVRQYTEYIVG